MDIGAVVQGETLCCVERTVLLAIGESRRVFLRQHQSSKAVVKVVGKHFLKIEMMEGVLA